jgi:hypothetical protein
MRRFAAKGFDRRITRLRHSSALRPIPPQTLRALSRKGRGREGYASLARIIVGFKKRNSLGSFR